MKRINKFVLFFSAFLITFTVFGQSTDQKNQPQKDIKVNREYDEHGNLIRYDSTYVYSWSSDSTHQFIPDSAFFNRMDIDEMHKRMQEQMSRFFGSDSLRHKYFRHPFFSDDFFDRGFFYQDFFNPQFFGRDFHFKDSSHNDFFKQLEDMMEGRREFKNQRMDKMHKELDSLRQNFMQQRRKYYQQRDSIYRKHKNNKDEIIDI